MDLISNSVESEDGEEVFWNPFPLLCVPVSQCPSVLPFLLSRSPGQSASEAWGETNMKRDKNSSMVSKKKRIKYHFLLQSLLAIETMIICAGGRNLGTQWRFWTGF